MINRIWMTLLVILVGLGLGWGMWVFQANQEQFKTRPVTPVCDMRIILDRTYANTKDCWVVLECKDSFESLFQSKSMDECVQFLNNQK